MFSCVNLDYLLSCDLRHGIELIKSFLDERDDKELQRVYYFARPNGINREYSSYESFKKSVIRGGQPQKTADDIMSEVKEIMKMFSPQEDTNGNI